jgi:hypothetical protein
VTWRDATGEDFKDYLSRDDNLSFSINRRAENGDKEDK